LEGAAGEVFIEASDSHGDEDEADGEEADQLELSIRGEVSVSTIS